MKIRKLTEQTLPKALALLGQAFPGSRQDVSLFEKLHDSKRELLEWGCVHCNKVIAYIAFSNAFEGQDICGKHLFFLAVNPEFQNQGVGSEILRFALRQKELKEQAIFVFGDPKFFTAFGFERCSTPTSPFESKKKVFLSLGNRNTHPFSVGYEQEFMKTWKKN